MEKLHLTLINGPRLIYCDYKLDESKQLSKKKTSVKCQYTIKINVNEEKNEVSALLSAKSEGEGLPFSFDLKSEAIFKCDVSCPSEQHIIIEAIPYVYPFIKELVADLTRKSYYPPFYLPPIELKLESFEKVDE